MSCGISKLKTSKIRKFVAWFTYVCYSIIAIFSSSCTLWDNGKKILLKSVLTQAFVRVEEVSKQHKCKWPKIYYDHDYLNMMPLCFISIYSVSDYIVGGLNKPIKLHAK